MIDTEYLSSGMGLMVLQAAKLAAADMPRESVLEQIGRMRVRVRTSFVVDDTGYLMQAGRISPRINTICKAVMAHPILQLKNGKMQAGAVKIGTRKSVWKKYVDSMLKGAGRIDKSLLFLTHA